MDDEAGRADDARPAIGQALGQYRIEAQLGAGGMGVVYRARDTRLNRLVALKVIGGRTLLVSAAREELLREGRAASALNHPNICTVHEIAEAQGQIFMVMEYVDGSPLSTLIPPDGLPIEVALRYAIQIADALEHAHEGGVVHRDLKSSNVMVTREGRVKVVDFGLARRTMDPARDKTTELYAEPESHDKMAGTLAYMAPEILRGQQADASSDIWALGVLLYEISAGRLPFHGATTFELTDAILREPVAPLPARVPPALRAIVLRCLAKEPKQRYRRAGEVRAALEAVDSYVGALPALVQKEPEPRTRWWYWAAAIGLAIAAAATAVAIFWSGNLPGSSAPPSGQGGRLTLLESSERRAFDPTLSPDGKMVAYIAESAPDVIELFVARVSGGQRVQLTHDDAREEHPRFSPDGERILFSRRRAASAASEICTIAALGGDITTVVANAAYPVWSPDGARVAFVQRDPSDNALVLATVALDGSDRRVVLRGDGTYPFLRNPAWSPDGRQIVIVRSRGGISAGIWTVPASGGSPVQVSDDPANTFSDDPVFTLDGRGLIHSSNRGGATNIWFLPLAGQQAVRLTTGPGPDESPTVARDGTVAFVNSRWRNALLVHDLRTGETRSVLTHSPFLWAPAFSPNGQELAFSRGEVDGSWHVWVVPVAGGAARQVTAGPLSEVYPRYMPPDGGSILYQTWSAPRSVWRVPREGGPAIAMISAQGSDDGYADVSPDGRWLVFARAEAQVEHMYVVAVGGGPERLLTTSAGSVPRWSPDGNSIVFSPDRGYARGVFVIAADGTGERRVTERGGWPVWWPDGTRIGYRIVGADGNQQIVVVPSQGGLSTPIDALRFGGANMPFDVSRDGRLLATTNAVHVSDEIWLLRPER